MKKETRKRRKRRRMKMSKWLGGMGMSLFAFIWIPYVFYVHTVFIFLRFTTVSGAGNASSKDAFIYILYSL